MHFLDDALLPENQQKLVIQVAPYGPQWVPGDSSDIPVTMDEQIQKAVDCYEAGAAVLQIERTSFAASGAALEFTRSIYRGDTYDFVAELSLGDQHGDLRK